VPGGTGQQPATGLDGRGLSSGWRLADVADAILGSAVILHAGAGNFADIPAADGPLDATTLATGDAGPRYACGVVVPAWGRPWHGKTAARTSSTTCSTSWATWSA
jgi:hypothetical protein